jgi:hypothetical protein
MLRVMRRVAPLLLLLMVAAVVFGLQGRDLGRTRSALTPPAPSEQERAEEALTLLDVWSQELVPDILLVQQQTQAVRTGDSNTAARLARRFSRALLRVERFAPGAAADPVLRNDNSIEVQAVRAAAAGWGEWASAVLWHGSMPAVAWVRRIAALRTRAVELQNAAYTAVDAAFSQAMSYSSWRRTHSGSDASSARPFGVRSSSA